MNASSPLGPSSDISISYQKEVASGGGFIVSHEGRQYLVTDYTHVDMRTGKQTKIAHLDDSQQKVACEIIKALFAPKKMQDALKGLADNKEGTFNVDADEKIEKATLDNAKVEVTKSEFKEMRERIGRAWNSAHPAASAPLAANDAALVHPPAAHAPVPFAAAASADALVAPNPMPSASPAKESEAAEFTKKTKTDDKRRAEIAKLKAELQKINQGLINEKKEAGKTTAMERKEWREVQAKIEDPTMGLAGFAEVADAEKTTDLRSEILRAQFAAHLASMDSLLHPLDAEKPVSKPAVVVTPASQKNVSEAVAPVSSEPSSKLGGAKITITPLPAKSEIMDESRKIAFEFKKLQNELVRAGRQGDRVEQSRMLDEMVGKFSALKKIKEKIIGEQQKKEFENLEEEFKTFVKNNLGIITEQEMASEKYLLGLNAQSNVVKGWIYNGVKTKPDKADLCDVVIKKTYIQQLVLGGDGYTKLKAKINLAFENEYMAPLDKKLALLSK